MRSSFSRIPSHRRATVLALGALALLAVGAGPASAASAGPSPAVTTGFTLRASFTPNDFLYPLQWGLPHVDAPRAWDVTIGSPSVVVAVVDTGVWWTHEDIEGNMWSNTDGTHGRDFIDGDTNPMDQDTSTWHGTGVAGVLAAIIDNRADVAGAAQVSVMAVRALGANGEGSSYNTSQAIRWAADNGARVINLSLGTNETFVGPTDMQLAIDYAWRKGALIVAAAGNGGPDQIGDPVLDFPARLPNVIAVAALDQGGSRAGFSNYGTGLDLSAPGAGIWTLSANDGTQTLSGTSVAAPFVSAAAALIWSVEPTLTNIEVWNILNATAVPIGSGYNTNYGWGEVNYWNALNALQRPFISVNSFPARVSPAASFSIGWSILGPAGMPVTDTHVEWGTASGQLGNATSALTGTTKQSYTAPDLRMPEGASAMYFKVVADVTVNGTSQRFESEERVITLSDLPPFLEALYQLLASNLLYLAIFVLTLAAVVAFLPQRRARRRRAVAYRARAAVPPGYQAYSPPPGPPAASAARPVDVYRAASREPATVSVIPSAGRPAVERPLAPTPPRAAPVAAAAPTAPAKKRCPACGTMVSADNLFCFFCGEPFR